MISNSNIHIKSSVSGGKQHPNFTSAHSIPMNSSTKRKFAEIYTSKVYLLSSKLELKNKYFGGSKTLAESFGIMDHLGLDAFRHAWASADISMRYGHFISKTCGDLNDYLNVLCDIPYTNQDLWNNKIGRKLAKEAKKLKIQRSQLPEFVYKAYNEGRLIINPLSDMREYKSFLFNVLKKINKNLNRPKQKTEAKIVLSATA